MEIYRSESAIITDLQKNSYRIIGIDGVDGAGKSTLAKTLGKELNLSVISLDTSLIEDQKSYVANIKYDELSEKIKKIDGPFIIEGVCLLDVLEKLSIKSIYLIYVKVLNERSEWIDEEEFNSMLVVEEVIKAIEYNVKIVAKHLYGEEKGLTPFRKEVIRYHHRKKPFIIADSIFERVNKL